MSPVSITQPRTCYLNITIYLKVDHNMGVSCKSSLMTSCFTYKLPLKAPQWREKNVLYSFASFSLSSLVHQHLAGEGQIEFSPPLFLRLNHTLLVFSSSFSEMCHTLLFSMSFILFLFLPCPILPSCPLFSLLFYPCHVSFSSLSPCLIIYSFILCPLILFAIFYLNCTMPA